MKIEIISSYAWIKKHNNYGALLQYFALQEFLKDRGHESSWIRYEVSNSSEGFVQSGIKSARRCLMHGKRLIMIPNYYTIFRQTSSVNESFQKFVEMFLNTSEQSFDSWDKLCLSPPDADLYITGSDQVWAGTDKANYLEFVPTSKKCISYAASFGADEISASHENVIQPYLKKFSSISVRESGGGAICQKMNYKATHVVDPTLLLSSDQYRKLLPKTESTEQVDIFAYFLNTKSLSEVYWEQIENIAVQKNLTLKVSAIQDAETVFPFKYQSFLTPQAWLSHYDKTKYVVTNSYHGTLFAIIFQKTFLLVRQDGAAKKQNCRFVSILTRLGLMDRYYNPDKGDLFDQLYAPIDWTDVQSRLDEFKEESVEFLTRAGL